MKILLSILKIIKNNIMHIKICKIDTEGLDEQVIKGLYEYLEKTVLHLRHLRHHMKTTQIRILCAWRGRYK